MLNSVASLALIHRASRERSYTAGPLTTCTRILTLALTLTLTLTPTRYTAGPYTSTPYTVRYGQQGARSTSKRFRASFI